MVRISTTAGRPLACDIAQFAFVAPWALLFNACHRASVANLSTLSTGLRTKSRPITLSAPQGTHVLAAEIRRSPLQIKPSPAKKSPKSKNSVERLLRGIPVANPVLAIDESEKNREQTKLNFLLVT
jgi:hypothetical protein